MKDTPSTGQALRHLRDISGLTLDQVAELAEVSPTYLSRVETGRCRPSLKWTAGVTRALSDGILGRSSRTDSHLGASA
ncbi:helix-turn-helix domain-containing protein [Rhodococcus qingshengii]